jgi:tetratricopeptide (TPR) repeat protein
MENFIWILAIIVIGLIIFRLSKQKSISSIAKRETTTGYSQDKNSTEKALKQFLAKDYKSAIANIDSEMAEREFFTKEAFDIRAMSLENLGYIVDAIDDFSQSLTIDKNDANIYYLRGLAKQKIGEYSEAKSDLRKAVELKPNTQQYRQMFDMLETLVKNPMVEKRAKEKAEQAGKLVRRVKAVTQISTNEPDQKDFKDGFLDSLEKLQEQAKADPKNEDLKKLLQDSEKKYMDEFVYKKR